MNEPIFTVDEVRLLLSPERWRLVLPGADGENPVPPDSAPPEPGETGSHGWCELLFALSGDYPFNFNMRRYTARAGTLFVILPHILHEQHYRPDTRGVRHLWCYPLGRRVLVRLLAVDGKRRDIFMHAVADLPPEYELGSLCAALSRPAPPEIRFRMRRRLEIALSMLFDLICVRTEQPAATRDFQVAAIEFARLRIEENFTRGIDVGALARAAGFSRYYFARLFRHYTGGTVQEYIDHCRLREMRTLSGQRRSGKEIAARLGFATVAAFYHWRRKQLRGSSTE